MNTEEISKKVIELVSEQLNVPIAKITADSKIGDGDLQADSLDLVELIMAIEDEFEVEINEQTAQTFKSISDIVTFIDQNTAQK